VRSPRFAQLLARIFVTSQQRTRSPGTLVLDARPLPVGACSKDQAATAGRVYRGFARGYRLHALVDAQGYVRTFRLTAMNVGEPDVALALLAEAPAGSTVLTDGVNDSARLYEVADARGVCFRARPRKGAGQGHRQQSALRLRGIADWHANVSQYERLRGAVERAFAWQSSFGGGLCPLPAWVRTPARTERWVTAKLVLYHLRRTLQQRAA
jgi:hypothetical protein